MQVNIFVIPSKIIMNYMYRIFYTGYFEISDHRNLNRKSAFNRTQKRINRSLTFDCRSLNRKLVFNQTRKQINRSYINCASRFTAPGAPPSDIRATAEDSESIRVEWKPPPVDKQHGDITYYKLMIVNNTRPDSDASVITISDPNQFEYLITNLKKWTEYRVWMLAGTVIGDGVKSDALFVRTDEDGMCARVCCFTAGTDE